MAETEPFQETVTKVDAPTHHYSLIRASDGEFLGVDADGTSTVLPVADDRAIWDRVGEHEFRHVTSGLVATIDSPDTACKVSFDGRHVDAAGRPGADDGADFFIDHGPEKLPSEYLTFFKAHGWVCLTAILSPAIVEGLEKVACTDRYAERVFDTSRPALNQTSAIAKTAAEPVSLWLIRQYMQTDEIRLAHTPGLAVLDKDDGKRNVQGWHSDFPYLWGITGRSHDGRVPTSSGPTVLGIQRNVCISDFTKVGGATAFKLGSHVEDQAPPKEWGRGSDYFQPGAREERGLPYTGPDADIIEAPGGSIILYDARTWHRAGINRTDNKRAAMLQAMTPMYIMPFADTSGPYKSFVESDAYQELTGRERDEMRNLMVHYIAGPGGTLAITVDEELSELVQDKQPAPRSRM